MDINRDEIQAITDTSWRFDPQLTSNKNVGKKPSELEIGFSQGNSYTALVKPNNLEEWAAATNLPHDQLSAAKNWLRNAYDEHKAIFNLDDTIRHNHNKPPKDWKFAYRQNGKEPVFYRMGVLNEFDKVTYVGGKPDGKNGVSKIDDPNIFDTTGLTLGEIHKAKDHITAMAEIRKSGLEIIEPSP